MFKIRTKDDELTACALLKLHNKRKLTKVDELRIQSFMGELAEQQVESVFNKCHKDCQYIKEFNNIKKL